MAGHKSASSTHPQENRLEVLSKEAGAAIVHQAEAFGDLIVPMIMMAEASLQSPQERLVWWAGLMSYLGGLAASGLGAEALFAVSAMTEKLVKQTIDQRAH